MFIIIIDNVNAVLNLNCNGDLNFSTSTAKHSSTLSTRTMTELSSKSSTTPASTTPRTTPPPPPPTTTKTHRTTTPTTTLTATTTDILSQMTDISATLSTLSPIAPQSATSKQSTASIHVESPALSICKHSNVPSYSENIIIYFLQCTAVEDKLYLESIKSYCRKKAFPIS